MKYNMGLADRIVRIILAIIFITLYLTGVTTGALGIVLLVFSVIFVLTSLVKICPLYIPFGFSTCSKTKAEA